VTAAHDTTFPTLPPVTPPLAELVHVSKWYGAVIALNDVSLPLEGGSHGIDRSERSRQEQPDQTAHRTATPQPRHGQGPRTARMVRRRPSGISDTARCGPILRRDVRAAVCPHFGRIPWLLLGSEAAERTEHILAQVGMLDRADRPVAGYSKGMRQRIKLAQALIHDPDLIVLDEPLNGIDPAGGSKLAATFRRLADQGKGLLISSHILEEMEELADRVLFICRGRILAAGTLAEVRSTLNQHPMHLRITVRPVRLFAQQILATETVLSVRLEGNDSLRIEVDRPQRFFEDLGRVVEGGAFEVERLQVMDASAEAIFQYLMQESWRP
jgi:ABC-2 type transport system ATP-binding protein